MLELFLPLSPLAFVRDYSELPALLRSCGAARNETTLGEVVGSGENFSVYHMIAAKAVEQMFSKYRNKVEETVQQSKKVLSRITSRQEQAPSFQDLKCLDHFLKNYVHYDPDKKKDKEEKKKEMKRCLSTLINFIEMPKSQSSACFITLPPSIMHQSSKNF